MTIYPVAKPSVGSEEALAVTRVLESGLLSLGPVHREFEEAFAARVGTRYACSVSSGTAGLHLAMIAAGIGPGDEVITTPFSFVASANCILYVGATPVFIDIDPVTYNLDPARLEEKITSKTKAILAVHIFGHPADMEAIMRIAEKHGLKVIEDACESICATARGQQVGTFGESAVFAFYPNKQMTTGEGGMLVTNEDRVYRLCKSLANQGRGDDMQWLDHQYLGYNYRLDEMSAAVGLVQLSKLDWLIQERRRIAAYYDYALAPYADRVRTPVIMPGNTHTYFVYVIELLAKHGERQRIIESLKQKGIMTKPYLPSIHLFSFYRERFGFKPGDLPVSEGVSERSLALPFYVGLTPFDIRTITTSLIETLDQV